MKYGIFNLLIRVDALKPSSKIWQRVNGAAYIGGGLTEQECSDLDGEIDTVLAKIAEAADLSHAKSGLDELADIHHVLAVLAFKYHLSLSPKQRALVRRYDRHDVEEVRSRVFRAAKEGRFP